jgi:2-furoyl-CoA dehydrogenase FAD binding subunit
MPRRLISSGSAFEDQIGYSRAVVDGDDIFVSGTKGYEDATLTIADDVIRAAKAENRGFTDDERARHDEAIRSFELATDEADKAETSLGDDARILAGGQSLMAVLNMRLARPKRLLDVSRSQALATARIDSGALQVGAAVTQAAVEHRPRLAQEVPLLALAFPWISHVQIRNRGTVAGSVAHADPSAELPLVLTALRGEVCLRSQRGARRLAADDFFTGMLLTARADDELIEAVRFPVAQTGQGFGFEEFGIRHGDFALCAVAAVADARNLRVAVGRIGR